MKNKNTAGIIFICLFFLTLALASGLMVAKRTPSQPVGRWRLTTLERPKPTTNKDFLKLIALGYLQGYEKAPSAKNVTVYTAPLTYDGLNFVVSGHSPYACIMDMHGTILHTWRFKTADVIWPDCKREESAQYWRRAYLYPNGDLLAIYEGIGLIKIDKDSNLIWTYTSEKKPHHDLQVMADGRIHILTRETKSIPRLYEKPVLEDYITTLQPDGNPLRHVSLLALVENSAYAKLMENIIAKGDYWGDLFHTNTLEIFDGRQADRSPLFKRGNALISMLIIDTIAIIDLEAQRLVWAMSNGMWRKQHQPTLLENGNFMIFDNLHAPQTSAIIEFEPFSQKITWDYTGDAANRFFSQTCGSCQRLPNGNTLITETDYGRAFEVTPEKRIVWEYLSPFRAGKNKDFIATLPEVIRIDPQNYDFLESAPNK